MPIRLQTFLRDHGIASRRKAEELIARGKVLVNGKPAELGMSVDPAKDEIKVRDRVIRPQAETADRIVIALNKPAGYTTTSRRFKGERNVFALVKNKQKLFAVGRLDKDSAGLLLLTNDGNLAYHLTHPKFEHEKEYVVTSDKAITPAHARQLQKGVRSENELLKAKKIRIISPRRLSIILTQGRKRHIRRMLQVLGYQAVALKRIRIGKFMLGSLKSGLHKRLSDNEIEQLLQ